MKYDSETSNKKQAFKISILMISIVAVVALSSTPTGANQDSELNTSSGNSSYVTGDGEVIVDPDITVESSDNISGVKASIGNGFIQEEDDLGYNESLAEDYNITGNYDDTKGVLNLSSSSSLNSSVYQEVLRTVTYNNSALNPNTTTRNISFSIGQGSLYCPDTGHYYEWVSDSGVNWTDANSTASDMDYFGLQGYLVTVTSQEENNFVTEKLSGEGWMGASDNDTESDWYWVTGPEAGTKFFNQTAAADNSDSLDSVYDGNTGGGGEAVDGEYNNWADNEPNDYETGEDYAHFYPPDHNEYPKKWNDYPYNKTDVEGYVVEYGGMSGDPSLNLSDQKSVTVTDTVKPNITIESPINASFYYTTSLTLDASANEEISQWVYNLNDNGNQTFTPSTTITLDAGTSNTLIVYAQDDSGNWNSSIVDFSIAEEPVSGDGTEKNPYQIAKASHLKAVHNNLNANYILVNDIDASETVNWNSGSGFDPIGIDHDNPFDGTFDGNGYTISNLTVNRGSEDYVGLFGYIEYDGHVKNLVLENVNITGYGSVGGLAGDNSGTLENSYATGSVSGSSYVGGLVGYNHGHVYQSYATGNVNGSHEVGGLVGFNEYDIEKSYSTGNVRGDGSVGGLVGVNDMGYVRQSYATGDVSGGDMVGGLVGMNWDHIETSYATGSVSGSSYVGGLVGEGYGIVDYSYWDTETTGQSDSIGGTGLTTSEMQGFEAETNMDGLDFTNVWKSVDSSGTTAIATEDSYPILRSFDQQEHLKLRGINLFDNGDGDKQSPYEISNWIHLNNTRQNLDAYFTLVNDLNKTTDGYDSVANETANVGAGFDPIGYNSNPFTGTFDGNGHIISNLVINRSNEDNIGMFKESSGTIEDLVLKNVAITGNNSVGGVAGKQGTSPTTVKNVTVTGTVNGTNRVGGAIGYLFDDDILNTTTDVIVNGTDSVGGLVGYASGSEVNDCNSTGQVNGTTNVGGLVGYNEIPLLGTIQRSYSKAEVNGTTNVGGLIGYNRNDLITQSYATGSVNGVTNVGGLVGNTTGSNAVVNLSYSAGKVIGDSDVGGLIGTAENGATVEDNAYWDTETSVQSSSDGDATPLTTGQMKGGSAMENINFDFVNTWNVVTGSEKSYPYLRDNTQTPEPGLVPVKSPKEEENDDNPVRVGRSMPHENVQSTDSKQKVVLAGKNTVYDFDEGSSSVKGISFESKENIGRVVAKLQTLDKLPDDVKSPTETDDSGGSESGENDRSGSKTYSTMSITVGSEGTVSDDNSDSILIEFEVTREWVKNNNIDPSTIRLERYHNGEWNKLPTNMVEEDENLLHFTASTPGFSVFTVVGDEIEETGTVEEQSDTVSTANDTPKRPEPDTKAESEESIPGFTSLLALGVLGAVYTILRRK